MQIAICNCRIAVSNSRRNLVQVSLVEDKERWRFDLNRIEDAVTPKTRLFLLCNPHNPVGRVWKREELARLGEICQKHNVLVISDEIHGESRTGARPIGGRQLVDSRLLEILSNEESPSLHHSAPYGAR